MPKSPARRQAASRARFKAEGFARITLRLDSKTTARLRRLAKQQGATQAGVVAMALQLLDSPGLVRDIRAWAAARKAGGQ